MLLKLRISVGKRVDESLSAIPNRIVLDVGGQKFSTSKANLLRFPNTFFTGLLSKSNWNPEVYGSYFIDSDSTHFELVLDYLRGEPFWWKSLSADGFEILKSHFDYFLIRWPEEVPAFQSDGKLRWHPLTCNYLSIKNGDRTIEVPEDDYDEKTAFAQIDNFESFRVRITSISTDPSEHIFTDQNTSLRVGLVYFLNGRRGGNNYAFDTVHPNLSGLDGSTTTESEDASFEIEIGGIIEFHVNKVTRIVSVQVGSSNLSFNKLLPEGVGTIIPLYGFVNLYNQSIELL